MVPSSSAERIINSKLVEREQAIEKRFAKADTGSSTDTVCNRRVSGTSSVVCT